MDPFRPVISTWVEVAATLEMDLSMLDLATRMHRHLVSLRSVEVVSTVEAEEGAEETLASVTDADLQMIEAHSDLETDHRPLDGEVYLATIEMTGDKKDARMIVGSIVMIASVSLNVSEEILRPADSIRVRPPLINKCR